MLNSESMDMKKNQNICSKSFGQNGNLHMATVHGKFKNNNCDLCGKSFPLMKALKAHQSSS